MTFQKISLLLIWMVFMHVCDDYYLQGILAKLKQREWWETNAPDERYKNDYIVALVMHSFSWAVMIMFPIFVFDGFNVTLYSLVALIGNMTTHAIVDDAKANKHSINLIQDQIIHILQIAATAFFWIATRR